MKERPILFSGPMVRAILEGRKTQTRRVARDVAGTGGFVKQLDVCPYGVPGDRLWVKETLWIVPEPSVRELRDGADTWPKPMGPQSERIGYAADDPTVLGKDAGFGAHYREWGWKKRPAIFMPRWASRITLEITEVRVQRLQEISEEDAIAEGVYSWSEMGPLDICARPLFSSLWDSINAKLGFGWPENPWVFALTFKLLDDVRG